MPEEKDYEERRRQRRYGVRDAFGRFLKPPPATDGPRAPTSTRRQHGPAVCPDCGEKFFDATSLREHYFIQAHWPQGREEYAVPTQWVNGRLVRQQRYCSWPPETRHPVTGKPLYEMTEQG